ncbi:Transferase [Arabidopsis suecica]|uniref:Transferase n=1 Tax=Arabidopsis suecica TaxID=45249 RepID=A0A8T1Z6A8_ARASU|nr:Transferase [Arabidopsis suecica]
METKIPKSMIAGVQSVMPVEVTRHREIRSISVVDPVGVGIFRRTLNIVTYYKEACDSGDERGWFAAGWIKESLGRALTEQPMLSGRLRRRTTSAEAGLELVANDSGIRMVEAKFPASLPDFLEMVKRDKSRAEAETVFWKDIDENEPQYSPLFYVQVTNFESGGYSIGISCSILIADLLLETDFLTKWAQIQTSLAHSQTTIKPIFHLPSLKQDFGNFLIEFSRSASVLDRGELVAFQAKTCLKISPACIGIRKKTRGDVFLFIKEKGGGENSTGCDGMKVQIHSSDEVINGCDCGSDLEETNDGVLDKSLTFGERLEVTSCWVGCVSKGVVFVFPSIFEDAKSLAKFIVALPKE